MQGEIGWGEVERGEVGVERGRKEDVARERWVSERDRRGGGRVRRGGVGMGSVGKDSVGHG